MSKRKKPKPKPKPAAVPYDPTPEEIAEMTAEIRRGWAEGTDTPRKLSLWGGTEIKREHKIHTDLPNDTEGL